MHSSETTAPGALEMVTVVESEERPRRRPRRERPRTIKLTAGDYALRGVSYVVVSLFALFCALPFVLIISASFSSESEILRSGFVLLPKGFTLTAEEVSFRGRRASVEDVVHQ